MTQLELFPTVPYLNPRLVRPVVWHASAPYQSHSATSKAAARKIKRVVKSLKEQVYDALQAAGERGLTDDEGQALMGMGGSTYRPRRIKLVEDGRGYQLFEGVPPVEVKRPTRSGRMAAVWRAV